MRTLLLTLSLTLTIPALAQSTKGTDFWMGYMQNFNGDNNVQKKLFISGTGTATSGTVSIPLGGWSQNFTVTANGTTVVTLPTDKVQTTNAEVVEGKGIHITSAAPVSVVAITSDIVRTESSAIFPTALLGSEYYIMSYPGFWGPYGSEALIAGVENNTVVDIVPSVRTSGGKSANVKFSVTLDSGEVYLIRADGNGTNKDLTGTRISVASSNPCSKIAVFGGTGDAYVPASSPGTADPLYEQMRPTDKWGTDYIIAPLFMVNGSVVRIVASQTTSVSLDGGAPVTVAAGKFAEFDLDNKPHCINTDKPVMAAQFLKSNQSTGQTSPNSGDPDMMILTPTEQVIKHISFRPFSQSAGGNTLHIHRINVVIKTSAVSSLRLDGTAVNASGFNPACSTGYSYGILSVTGGDHTLASDSGFVAYLYGYGNGDESYSHSMGWAPVSVPLVFNTPDSVCINQPVGFTASGGNGTTSWNWSFGDGNTGAGQNVSHTYTATGTYTVKLTGGSSGTCSSGSDSAVRTIRVVNCVTTPTVAVTGGAVCSGGCFTLTAVGNGGTAPYTYQWSNGLPATAGPHNVCPSSATTYTVTIIDQSGNFYTDTAWVAVNMPPAVSSVKQDASCFNNDGSATVTATGTSPFNFLWSSGGNNSTAAGLSAGTYTVTVSDSKGCSKTVSVEITQKIFSTTSSSTKASCNGGKDGTASVMVSGGTAPYTFVWSSAVSTTASASGIPAGEYQVNITDAAGCSKTETIEVPAAQCGVIIPNVFTPAGDGFNDKFIIEGLEDYPGSQLKIFNRWGTLVYENSNYQNDWDGRALKSLNRLSEGVYYYILHLSDGNVKNGFITLVRSHKF